MTQTADRKYLSFVDDICWGCYSGTHEVCDGRAWCFVMGELTDCACLHDALV